MQNSTLEAALTFISRYGNVGSSIEKLREKLRVAMPNELQLKEAESHCHAEVDLAFTVIRNHCGLEAVEHSPRRRALIAFCASLSRDPDVARYYRTLIATEVQNEGLAVSAAQRAAKRILELAFGVVIVDGPDESRTLSA